MDTETFIVCAVISIVGVAIWNVNPTREHTPTERLCDAYVDMIDDGAAGISGIDAMCAP